MTMLYRAAFLALLALVTAAVVRAGYRRERTLGRLLVCGAVLYVCGAFAMGWYLRDVRGREYLAPDEVAFQTDGQRRLQSWLTRDLYVPVLPGGYPLLNAAVIGIWGPSPVPMRLVNAVSGVISIYAAYLLGLRLFRDPDAARWGALLVLLSPSLTVWTVNNVKERPLSLLVTVAALAGVTLLERWTWRRCLGFALAICALGIMRHYYAGILAWLAIALFLALSTLPWRQRLLRAAVLVLLLGFALLPATGSFLAVSMRGETVMRYVSLSPSTGDMQGRRAADARRQGQSAGTGDQGSELRRGDGSQAAAGAGDASEDADQPPGTKRENGLSLVGETTGAAERAGGRSVSSLAKSLLFVMFGRFDPRGSAGRVMSVVLFPEWLLGFVLLPLALAAVLASLRLRRTAIALPAAFVASMIALLAWTHGDDWTTLRFRSVYWPELLVLAAGGIPVVSPRIRQMVARVRVPGRTGPPQV